MFVAQKRQRNEDVVEVVNAGIQRDIACHRRVMRIISTTIDALPLHAAVTKRTRTGRC